METTTEKPLANIQAFKKFPSELQASTLVPLKSSPRILNSNTAPYFDEDKLKPAIDPNETENEASIRKHKERIEDFDEKAENRSC